MKFTNIKNRLVIDGRNARKMVREAQEFGSGYVARDFKKFPEGAFASPMPMPNIPRADWPLWIEMRNKTKSWPKDHKIAAGFKSLNQGGTNYCWINAVIAAMHYLRAMTGQKHVPLSPASVGAKIKRFRNVGGWGSQGLKYVSKTGAVPQSLWPANAISRKYDNEDSMAARPLYRCPEWWEPKPRSFESLVSAVLYGFPAPIGLLWWGHEVLAVKIEHVGRDDYMVDIDNSWGEKWGDNGHGLLTEAKATPDDIVVPRVLTYSNAQ